MPRFFFGIDFFFGVPSYLMVSFTCTCTLDLLLVCVVAVLGAYTALACHAAFELPLLASVLPASVVDCNVLRSFV